MAVDTVGAAGKPKQITGFQTHDTPVLLGHGERAELATEEYLAETPIMENFVILRKNPEYEASEAAAKEKASAQRFFEFTMHSENDTPRPIVRNDGASI